MSSAAALSSTGTSRTRTPGRISSLFAPSSPERCATSANSAREISTGLPRRPSTIGTTASTPSSRANSSIRLRHNAALDARHVAEQHQRACASSGHGGDSGDDRRGDAFGVARIGRLAQVEPVERGHDDAARVSGDDDDRRRAAGQTPLRRRGARAACRRASATSFVRSSAPPEKRAARPAASTIAAISSFAVIVLRLAAFARLRPRHDFHQQSAGAHAPDVGRRHRHAGQQPLQHPVEAILLRASARSPARRCTGLFSRERPSSRRLPGSTGMPKCSIVPPARFDRRGNHVAPVGDRGSAEDDDEIARAAPASRSPARAPASSCPTFACATMRAPARRQPLARARATVLSIVDGLRARAAWSRPRRSAAAGTAARAASRRRPRRARVERAPARRRE